MKQVTTIGLDLAKNIFQVHGVDAAGGIVVRKRLRRGQVLIFFNGLPHCLIGMEACATAHHCDAADAEAICEAVRRPTMRFVPVKTVEQQSALLMRRARDLLIRQRLGGISKRGDGYLRRLLINGAHAVLLVVAVALANKTARIAWAISSGTGS